MNNLFSWRCSVSAALFVWLSFSIGCGGGSSSSTLTTSPPPTINAHVVVSNTVTAPLSLAMSTSFQPAEYDDAFFTLNPTATTTLGNLLPQHVRLQGVSEGVPQTSATTWDFTVLDDITQPVLGVGDHSPEFQIAVAPAFMYDSNHNFLDPTYQQFGTYAQDLVRYYDTGGFTAADVTHVSPSSNFITWWGIYNEPNFNNLDSTQYTALYNAVVPMMQAVEDASINIKFVAVELGDYSGLAQSYLPAFVSGVTAHVDVLATHFYSSCNQSDTDTTIFATVPGFATEVQDIQAQMQTNPNLASVPVWITENNVNADYEGPNGFSTCNPTQTFVLDQRGSSAFFAAWRPYVFSQFAKVGVQALYHWDFGADAQYGEVDYNTGALQLSYWVDYWLARMFPAESGANILQLTNDDANVEGLAAQNADGSVVVMIANHDVVNTATDNNGTGAAQTASVDVSSLGAFSSASLLTIDASTSVTTGPVASSVAATSPVTVSLNGYGVAFLTLTK
jgi:Glycosyl hydrolase catalytic core